tara:strand:- start:510 stop:779 length:270 start_codon:yes stop_codon:yes gene_type:complete
MHDFANYRSTTYLGASKPEAAEWSPDIPSVMMGVIVGVFVAIVGFKLAEYRAEQAVLVEVPAAEEQVEEKPFVLEFYEALKVYEVLPRG